MSRCASCGRRGRDGHERCAARIPVAPLVEAPPAIAGYRLGPPIARGGFGAVWSAERLGDGRAAAIKVAGPDALALAQLRREARLLALVGPPAVPELLSEGALDADRAFLALALVEGETLAARLEDAAGALPVAEACAIGLAVLEPLAALHRASVAHLDLKPENIVLRGAPPRATLLDLGLSRRDREPAPELPAGAGTAEYMAPEQCAAAAVDVRADVYAFGALLFELLAGRPCFVGAPAEVKQAQVALRPPRLSAFAGVPPALDALVLRCLAKDPAERPADAAKVAAELRAAIGEPKQLEAASPAAASPAAASGPRPAQKRTVAAVFFSTAAAPPAVKAAVEALSGQLAHASRGQCVAVFDAASGDAPLDRAARAAAALLQRGIAARALVDLVIASAVAARGGPVRYLAAAFADASRHPSASDPVAVLLTEAAREALGALPSAPVRPGITTWAPPDRAFDATQAGFADPAIIGRDTLLAELVRGAQQAALGLPSIELVSAEAGQGKSRLSAALALALGRALPAAAVLVVRAPEPLAGGEDGALRLLLTAALGLSRDERDADRCSKAVRALLEPKLADEIFPAVALGLHLLGPDAPELRELLAAPGALRSFSLRALGELLRARAGRAPLCVVLDDAHLADDIALDALEYAALAETRAPIWICALSRPTLELSRKGFGERAARRVVHRMTGLEGADAEALCRRLLEPAVSVPGAAVRKLVERTQGVPLLLVELVRALKRDGVVRAREGSGSFYLATDALDRLPELASMDWLAQREVESLPPAVAAHARLLALLDAEIFPGEAEGVLAELDRTGAAAGFPLDAGVGARRLLDASVLLAGRRGAVRFRHALLRDAVARSVSAAGRKAVHAAAARWLRVPGGIPEERRLPLLAHHAAESGEAAEAASLYLALARRAQERHAYLDAEATYSRALLLVPAEDARGRLQAWAGRATMRYRIGRCEDALADFACAGSLARALGDPLAGAELLLDEATALDWSNDARGSADRVETARALLDGLREVPAATRARFLAASGRSLYRAGRLPEAAIALEQAVAAAELLGAEGHEPLVVSLILLETVLPEIGRIADASLAAERAISLCQERSDLLHLGSALNNRRMLQIAQGRLDAAVADQLRFVRIGRELGLTLAEYYSEINLGEMFCQAGDAASALPHVQRALEIEKAHPEVGTRPLAVLLEARLHAWRGDAEAARAGLANLRAQLSLSLERGARAGGLFPAEQVLADAVDLATRRATTAEIVALLERSACDSVEQEPLEVLDLCARSSLRSGRAADAIELWQRATSLAARLPNLFAARIAEGIATAGGPAIGPAAAASAAPL